VPGIGRREAFLWAAVCLLANQAVQLVDASSFEAFAASLATQNYIYWLACYAVIYRLQVSDQASRATRIDAWLVGAICLSILLTSFLPYRFATGLLASITAGYFLTAADGDRNVRAAGVVLLALSTQLVWGPILFQLFTPELLRADAALVGEMLTSVAAGYRLARDHFCYARRTRDRTDRRLFLVQQCLDRCAGLCRDRHAGANRVGSPRSRDRRDCLRRDDPRQRVSDLPAGLERRVSCLLA
jgi:hypothetical protein